jgi:hypothetical protein
MPVIYSPIPEEEVQYMSLKSWIANVKAGAYTDDDGYGFIATKMKMTDIKVLPSEYDDGNWSIPPWASHIVWYNA